MMLPRMNSSLISIDKRSVTEHDPKISFTFKSAGWKESRVDFCVWRDNSDDAVLLQWPSDVCDL